MRGQEWLMNDSDGQSGQDMSQANRLPAAVAGNLGGGAARRLVLPVALFLGLALATSGTLAAVLFRGTVDVSESDAQVSSVDWGAPVIEGIESELAVAKDGTIYVVWEDDRRDLTKTNTSDLYYSRSVDNGASWPGSTPAYTSSVTLGDPTLAVSGTQVYVAWVENIDDLATVAQKALTPTSSLTYTVPKTPTDLAVYRPDLEMDSTGRLHVVFYGVEADNKAHLYYSNNSLPGGGWLTATRIYTAAHGPGAGNPRLARDPDDDSLHVVFQEGHLEDEITFIRYISATNTAGQPSWHDSVTIDSRSDPPLDLMLPDIAIDRDNVIHVVWSRVVAIGVFGHNEGRPQYAYSTNRGATWTPPGNIDASRVYGVARSEPNNPWPRITTLPTTDTVEIYVVWEGERGSLGFWDDEGRLPAESVWLAVSSNRGTFWGLRRVSRSGDGPLALRPAVAADPDRGTVHVTWSQQKPSSDPAIFAIYRTYYSRGAAPSDVVYLPIVLK